MSDDVPELFRPRLCHVVKWPEFQGYGFNLHAEKGKAGQFIGKVDEHSPAETAGLKEGDRIVEVNGTNIGNENHQQVVTRIKSGGEETQLLVVDQASDNWYKEHKKVVKGDSPEVKFMSAKRDHHISIGLSNNNRDSLHEDAPGTPQSADEHISFTATKYEHNGHDEDHSSHSPRLCHMKTWAHFQGYGFNLHAERDKPGQYIGLVDDNSPASTAGLRVNDRIIEVNGVNVEKESHSDVIARIKAIPGETKLLVVDRETDSYYKERGITVSSSMPQTEVHVTPDASKVTNNGIQSQPVPVHVPEPEPEFTVAHKESEHKEQYHAPPAVTKGSDGLELNLSVAEIKERLKAKKKQDPRMNKISFEQKYKEFQRM
ncbi:Na(+)/H(+) exchange regulatory cofactor NHE-RF1 [Biomphalaria pfeifferi]|uniref:Na(+)/H(+) exchange regulatory cofactor NHE-RF1 n=1 Tax=Biomphalaria pfeifferi TaxID=112525 RepID=A0AAD8EVI3_BIOPF|nr:Na(+)/H(+) exchange regulatory cofactor NHE-RF1 [Biomphalaria pfeifferi]